ncbi:MAG: hypothetical protein GX635_12975, partial [Synergistaceae bacterium]|nr:hypothetical protein [Synergistaceae bacterium]
GMDLSLRGLPMPQNGIPMASQLFSESHSRFVAEVDPYYFSRFESVLDEWGVVYARLGKVTEQPAFRIVDARGTARISADISDLRNAWISPLAW